MSNKEVYTIPEINWHTHSDGSIITTNTIREYLIKQNTDNNPDSKKPIAICYDGKIRYEDSIDEAKKWVEGTNYPSVIAEYMVRATNKLQQIDDDTIRKIALANHFTYKDQPDGSKDLNPYVFDFARALIQFALQKA